MQESRIPEDSTLYLLGITSPARLIHAPAKDALQLRKKAMIIIQNLSKKELLLQQSSLHAISLVDRFLKEMCERGALENVNPTITACAAVWLATKYGEDAIKLHILESYAGTAMCGKEIEGAEFKILTSLRHDIAEPALSFIIHNVTKEVNMGAWVAKGAEKLAMEVWMAEGEREISSTFLAAWSILKVLYEAAPSMRKDRKMKDMQQVLAALEISVDDFMQFIENFNLQLFW